MVLESTPTSYKWANIGRKEKICVLVPDHV
ncbi:uncharacterized protein METZ01_LOCUS102299 [marine metagenome]|uniref:Uncharacterized protein n=1 Tax=marine metagenome TaxID=408172 RepID=A0A381WAD1_9ZZZZ